MYATSINQFPELELQSTNSETKEIYPHEPKISKHENPKWKKRSLEVACIKYLVGVFNTHIYTFKTNQPIKPLLGTEAGKERREKREDSRVFKKGMKKKEERKRKVRKYVDEVGQMNSTCF